MKSHRNSTLLTLDRLEQAWSVRFPRAQTQRSPTCIHFGVHQLVTRNANQASGGTPQTNSGGYLSAVFSRGSLQEGPDDRECQRPREQESELQWVFTTLAFMRTATVRARAVPHQTRTTCCRTTAEQHSCPGTCCLRWATTTVRGEFEFNSFMLAQSGKPYNITLPTDSLNNFFNQRPSKATASTPVANQVATSFGTLDVAPLPGEKLLPVNLGKWSGGSLIQSKGEPFFPWAGTKNWPE